MKFEQDLESSIENELKARKVIGTNKYLVGITEPYYAFMFGKNFVLLFLNVG